MHHEIHGILSVHKKTLVETNKYAGLPELTNSNGKECADSCVTQAWSPATLLDLIYDLRQDWRQMNE